MRDVLDCAVSHAVKQWKCALCGDNINPGEPFVWSDFPKDRICRKHYRIVTLEEKYPHISKQNGQ